MKSYIRTFLFCLGIMFTSCRGNETTGVVVTQEQKGEKNDPLIGSNKKIVELEDEEISLFIQRYGWKMDKTGTGLRFQSVKEGTGEYVQAKQRVTLKYTTILLTGEVLYTSEELGNRVFIVDTSDEIAGLHEAVKKMKKGGVAYIVLPSHLAYGIPGDGDKVPLRTPIAMKIELVEVENVEV